MNASFPLFRRRRRATAARDYEPDDDLPGTFDGVEIALELENRGQEPTGTARRVLERQAVFLDSQTEMVREQSAEFRRHRIRDVLFIILAAFAVALIGVFVWSAATSRAVVVDVFDTPPSMVERGITPQVMAGMVQDALGVIQAANIERARRTSIDNSWASDIKVQVPSVGISIGDIDRLLRAKLGHETHIGGSTIKNVDGTVSLTVRATGVPARVFTGPEAKLGDLAIEAANYIYGRYEPALYASYLVGTRTDREALGFVLDALPRAADDRTRSRLLGSWATLLSRIDDVPLRSIRKNREALSYDPYNWNAWGNLMGDVYTALGEEQGIRLGATLDRAIATAPPERQLVDLDHFVYQNYMPLRHAWTDQLDALMTMARATGNGRSTIGPDDAVFLAIAEAHRQGFDKARQLLSGTAPSVDRVAVANLVTGMERLHVGDAASAVAPLERMQALYLKDENLQYTFDYEPCYTALALGLVGRRKEADVIFAREGRWVACYAFQAEIAEKFEGPVAADRGFARAVALAPSSPFGYQRWGEVLVRRGDVARAEGMFRKAAEHGPRWADPYKSLGDLAARRQDWRAAIDLYDQATPFAPDWRDLAQRRAAAKAALAALPFWRRWLA